MRLWTMNSIWNHSFLYYLNKIVLTFKRYIYDLTDTFCSVSILTLYRGIIENIFPQTYHHGCQFAWYLETILRGRKNVNDLWCFQREFHKNKNMDSQCQFHAKYFHFQERMNQLKFRSLKSCHITQWVRTSEAKA